LTGNAAGHRLLDRLDVMSEYLSELRTTNEQAVALEKRAKAQDEKIAAQAVVS
jgi:hypothetical protein